MFYNKRIVLLAQCKRNYPVVEKKSTLFPPTGETHKLIVQQNPMRQRSNLFTESPGILKIWICRKG